MKSFYLVGILVLLFSGSRPDAGIPLSTRLPAVGGSVGRDPALDADKVYLAGEYGVLENVEIQMVTQPQETIGQADIQTEKVYQGAITFSFVYGFVRNRNSDLSNPLSGIGQTDLLNTLPIGNAYTVRLFIDLRWSGMEEAMGRARKLQNDGKRTGFVLLGISFSLLDEEGILSLGEITEYSLESPFGGWIDIDIPEPAGRIIVQPFVTTSSNGKDDIPVSGKWHLHLPDLTPHRGHFRSNVCQQRECLPGDWLAQFDWQAQVEDAIPVFCPGEQANGVTIQKARIETRPVWTDFTRESGFSPAMNVTGQKLVLIEYAAEPAARAFSLAYLDAQGAYQAVPLAASIQYGGDSAGTIALDRFNPGLRTVEQGAVLSASLPETVSLEQVWVFQSPYGPVWRLGCAGKS